jgi:hypothetical protein
VADIFDEVEGDYRAEQLREAATRYAWVAGVALLAVLAGVGLWQYRQRHQAELDTAASVGYLDTAKAADALVAGDTAGRIATARRFADFAASAPAGYRTLARLREAALLAGAGDLPRAQALWDQISTDPDADPLLRQLASLLWVERSLDTADPAALRTRLVSLTAADNAYAPLAVEAQALLDLRQGQTNAARTLFRRLASDPAAPAGVRGRDGAMLARLGG